MTRDRAAGLVLFAVGALTLSAAGRYERGTLQHIGPGWFPMLIAVILTALGAIVAARRHATHTTAVPPDPTTRSIVRAIAIPGAIAAFALLIERAGLFIAAPVAVVVASFSEREPRPREVVIRAVVLTVLAAAIFVVALGLPLNVWPPGVRGR